VISSSPDVRILVFNFALSLATGVLFGIVPALRATRTDLASTLKDQGVSVAGGLAAARFRKALVIAQVAMSLLLLVGAGLFIRSLHNLKDVDLGVRPESLVSFSIDATLNGYSPERTKVFYKQVMERVRALPGVTSAGFAAIGILEGNEWDSTVTIEGYTAKPGEDMNPYCNAVSPHYFQTMGIRLLAGRDFDERDEILTPLHVDVSDPKSSFRVVIANEKFIKRYFGTATAIGRHLGFGGDPGTKTPIEIIGVVKDAKYTDVRDEIPPQLFFPYLEGDFVGAQTAYVRTTHDPGAAFGSIRAAVQQLDANVPIYKLRTLEWQVDRSLVTERLIATLSTAFGALATALAVIGLYGVMAYAVARRTQEIGIRMALGAVTANVIWLVMREVLTLVASGLIVGVAATWTLSRLAASQLYGIAPHDPPTIGLAVLTLGIVAAAAGYVPALRATRVNPVSALRYE
jgi:predicted permease